MSGTCMIQRNTITAGFTYASQPAMKFAFHLCRHDNPQIGTKSYSRTGGGQQGENVVEKRKAPVIVREEESIKP